MTGDHGRKARGKSSDAFRTISETSKQLDVPQHVLRFWEGKFTQIKPLKRAGGRRYYRPDDLTLLSAIRDMLYKQGYTIKGVQKLLREKGLRSFIAEAQKDNNTSAVDANGIIVAGDMAQPPKEEIAPSTLNSPQRAELLDLLGDLQQIKLLFQESKA
jgi:DNA-binding transcriptional MerR regulator